MSKIIRTDRKQLYSLVLTLFSFMATGVHVCQSDVGIAKHLNVFNHLGSLFTNHINNLSSNISPFLHINTFIQG